MMDWTPPPPLACSLTPIHAPTPLTPDILIETCRPDSMNPEQQPVDRVSYHTANEKGILMFNKVLVNRAREYAYASQRDELEQLLNLSRSRGALSPAGP